MTEDLIDFSLQENESSIIKVIGVGGGGGNAVNYMYKQGIKDVDFIICNTDAQALETSEVPVKIQLGESLTEGRGAGNKPERGEQSAIENLEDINEVLADNTKMVFITAGMGGGTGTGAAPVIAKAAKDMGILTVGIVTIPFRFEGRQRLHQAIAGINKLKENVDSLLVINNEKLSEIYGDLKLSTAFSKADDVLATAAKGIAEIITLHGYINVDFEDVKTVMTDSGVAVMGSASAEGENRAVNAIRGALTSPLLNSNDVRGARNILLNISSGEDEVTMDEVGQITDYVQEAVGDYASIIWGTGQDFSLENKVSVTIIATGFDNGLIPEENISPKPESFKAGRGRSSVAEQVKMHLEEEEDKLEDNKLILTDLKDTEIDEIENIPAYKRKLNNLGDHNFQSGKIIRFKLDDE
ncbi:MAG: cell division protein FtsZ [Labilibaculum sp.]|nr:cell division protein FtsZ [Labilibaculum sp.]